MRPDFKDIPVVYLHPGEVFFSKKPYIVSTVLGSCLSITMFCSRTKFGGISHCQLPSFKEAIDDCDDCSEPYKYVNCTIIKMLEKFEQLNIKNSEIEVKIFGGAEVLCSPNCSGKKSIGRQNIIIAEKMMKKNNLKIVTSDLGGKQGRKILFVSNNGEVFLHRMKKYEKNKSISSR